MAKLSRSRFWLFIYAATALVHVPFILGLGHLLKLASVPGAFFIALLVACGLVWLLGGRIELLRMDQPISKARRHFVEEPFFVHWCACVGSFPVFLLLVIARITGLLENAFSFLGLIAYAGVTPLAAWGVVVRRRWVRVRHISLPIANLPVEFAGYTIAQLSDLHIGSFVPKSWGLRWADRVNELDVDLVALTGDYSTSGTNFHHDIAETFAAFKARDGVVAVMGNHDYFGDGERFIKLLRDHGTTVLRNERIELRRAKSSLTIAGVDDTWTRRANVAQTLSGANPNAPIIALSHDPELFSSLAARGADLVLSGHTHWGQIGVPTLSTKYNIARASFMLHAGLHVENGSTLYINPGLGTTGPPVRFGVAPEITIFHLEVKQQEATHP